MFGFPDSFSLEIAARTRYPYDDVHAALRNAANCGIPPDVAARWVERYGPEGSRLMIGLTSVLVLRRDEILAPDDAPATDA